MAKLKENTLPAIFDNRVQKYGERACVSYKKNNIYTDISWNKMREYVHNLASFLLNEKVKKGERIAIFSENRYEWWIADQAALAVGAVTVPIYATNSSEEAEYILKNSESRICFVSTADHLDRVLKVKKKLHKLKDIVIFNELEKKTKNVMEMSKVYETGSKYKKKGQVDKKIAAIKESDLASIIYTSGTTGDPKGVVLTHANFVVNVKQAYALFKEIINEDSRFLSFLPLSHVLERMAGYYLPIYTGSTVAFVGDVRTTLMEDLQTVRPSILISVPRIYEKIHSGILSKVAGASPVKRKIFNFAMSMARKNVEYNCKNKPRKALFAKLYNIADKLVLQKLTIAIGFDKIEAAISGGGPLSVSDAEFFLGIGSKIYEGYGLTETSPVITVNLPSLIKTGSVGPALGQTTIRISDEGEILVKGPQVMQGYYRDTKATKAAFTKDGFLKTGDIGILDGDGFLTITGRIKDIIVTSGGKNISPQNIENSLKGSIYIGQVALIGDRRKYLTALIVPSFEELHAWAEHNNITFKNDRDLLKKKSVLDLFKHEVSENTKHLSRVEQVKRFTLIPSEWSQDSGELTPSLKVKRNIVADKFSAEIEKMYIE